MRKKFILLLLSLFIGASAYAQVIWYKAYSFAYHQKTSYGYWTDWTDWYSCNIDVKIDWDNDYIIIYSNTPQRYVVTGYEGQGKDSSGGTQAYFDVIDQDYDRGAIRLRVETNGNSQLYVDFNNIGWVYNVRRQ